MKTKTPKKKVVKDVPKNTQYEIKLTIGDSVIKGSGATALSALESMQSPVEIATDGLLVITDGTRKAEQYLTPIRIRRLFYPTAQMYAADELEYLMNVK